MACAIKSEAEHDDWECLKTGGAAHWIQTITGNHFRERNFAGTFSTRNSGPD